MVNSLRRFSKPIMLVITVIVIVSFTVWGPNISRNSSKVIVGQLGGKDVSLDQFEMQRRKLTVYRMFGMMYSRVFSAGSNLDTARALVFEREAEAMGVAATQQQREEIFGQVPAFQGQDGKFSEQAYGEAVRRVLMPNGYSEKQVDDFLAGDVRLRSVMELVGTPVAATEQEARAALKKEQMTIEATYVELKQEDFEKDIKITDEELKKAYEERKEQFKTLPQRKVKFAAFALPPIPAGAPQDEEKAERSRLLQEYGEKAYELHEALVKPGVNFEALAKDFGATVGTTGFFDIQHPPAELEGSAIVAQEAFKLSKAAPYSRHLTKGDGLRKGAYVLAFDEEKAAEQKPFEQVKTELEAMLKKEKGNAAMLAKAKELKTKIEDAMKGGKSFYDALKELGQKPVALPVFGRTKRPEPGTKYIAPIYTAAMKMSPGQLSEPLQQQGVTLLAYLDRRLTGDGSELTAEEVKAKQEELTQDLRGLAFQAWLEAKAEEAGATPQKFPDRL